MSAGDRRKGADDAFRAGALESVKEAVRATDDSLGDVRRARIGARLAERLAVTNEKRTIGLFDWRGRARRAWLTAATAGAVALVAAGVAVWRGAAPSPATPQPASPFPAASRVGAGGPAATSARAEHIEVPAGTRVRARLGDRARTTLVGPAIIDVLTSTSDLIDVRLVSGTLLAEYDGRRGGLLRVRAPAATVEVVGTLFGVEAGVRGTAVSVAHGVVRVTRDAAARPILVGALQTLAADEAGPRPISAPMRDHLEAHQSEGEARGAHDSDGTRPDPEPPPTPRRKAGAASRHTKESALAQPPVVLAKIESRSPDRPPAPGLAAEPVPPSAASATGLTAGEGAGTPSGGATAAPPSEPPRADSGRPPAGAVPPERAAAASSASQLYRAAETAMQRRDRAGARQHLARVVAEFPGDRLAEVARYELAQIALADGHRGAAARDLETVAAASRDPALRRAAAFARCRLDLGPGLSAARTAAGIRCLQNFRSANPGAAEDAEVLALLIAHASQQAQCGSVVRLADEYVRRYPAGAFAAEAARRKHTCARAPAP
jgi:TolA-binding protein